MAVGLDGCWLTDDERKDRKHVDIELDSNLDDAAVSATTDALRGIKGVFNLQSVSRRRNFLYQATLNEGDEPRCEEIAAEMRAVPNVKNARVPYFAFPQ